MSGNLEGVKMGRKSLYDNDINSMKPGDKRVFGMNDYYRAKAFHQRAKKLGKNSVFNKKDSSIEIEIK